MKLATYEMRQAFETRDWDAALRIIESFFGCTIPEKAKASKAVYTGAAYHLGIDIALMSSDKRMRYAWHEHEGFSSRDVPIFIASAIYHNVPSIRIWQKTNEAN